MNIEGIKVRSRDVDYRGALEIAVFSDTHFAPKVSWEPRPENELDIEPTLRVPFECAQRLMDDLWHMGVRPTQAADSSGVVEAVKYHLEDMRELNQRLLGEVFDHESH